MSEDNRKTKCKQIKFNTYYIFAEEKQDVKEVVGLIFKDYIEKSEIDTQL